MNDSGTFCSGLDGTRRRRAGIWLAAAYAALLAVCEAQSPTNVNMVVTNDVSVNWIWATQYMFTATSDGQGMVGGVSNGWYDQGADLNVTATSAAYYHFTAWTGTVASTSNPLPVVLDGPCFLTAAFGADLATNGTPLWWLAAHGLTNGEWDALALADSDDDGLLNWQERVAGTDPTNASSLLRISEIVMDVGGRVPLSFATVAGREYQPWRAARLAETNWWLAPHSATPAGPLNTNSIPGSGTSVTTYVEPDAMVRFYRIGVRVQADDIEPYRPPEFGVFGAQ